MSFSTTKKIKGLVINPVTKSNENEHKKGIFHQRSISKGASIILIMYSNNDLDTITSTTTDKEVQNGAIMKKKGFRG
jgi:hypothetical protein